MNKLNNAAKIIKQNFDKIFFNGKGQLLYSPNYTNYYSGNKIIGSSMMKQI